MRSKLWKLETLCLVSVVLLSLIMACAPPPQEVEEAASFPIEVTDQLGRVVKLEKIPEKIISLAPSNTEILFALGLGDKVVGVTEYCNYPEAAKDKPKIGGYSTVDIEKVVAIEPGLILAAELHRDEVTPELERLGLTVLSLDPKTVDELLEAITLVGKCTGRNEEASRLVAEMRNRFEAVTDKTANLTEAQRPRVFYVVRHKPLWTAGSDTRIHELIKMAGGVNIFQDLAGYPTTGLEAVIEANPEVIICSSGMGSAESALQYVSTESRLKDVAARINNQVYEIETDLVSRPGPRLVDGFEQLARMIHPEIFGPIE